MDGRKILYKTTETMKLNVEKLVIPATNSLTQKIGIISAVLLLRLGVVRSPTIYLGRIPEENLLLLLRRNVVGQIEALLLIHPGGSSGRA